MWNKSFFLTILCGFLSFQASAQVLKKFVGNDQYKTVEYKVNDFHKLKMLDGFNVIHKISADSAGYISIYAEENILDLIEMQSKKGELKLNFSTLRTPEYGVVLIRLYSSALTEVNNEGSGVIEMQSFIEGPELNFSQSGSGQIKAENTHSGLLVANVTGSGDILVKGETGMGQYAINGSGEIRAIDTKAKEVRATITGGGDISCYAEKEIKTIMPGGGKIVYDGPAEITSRTVGSGQVVPANK